MDSKYLICAAVLMCYVSTCLATQPHYEDCGSKKGKVISVNISSQCTPDICYLKKGQNVNFQVKFAPNEMVNASKALVYGIVFGKKVPFKLPNSNGCDKSGLTCPLKPGQNVQYTSSIYVDKLYPSIKLAVEWYLVDQSNSAIWCVAIPVQLQ